MTNPNDHPPLYKLVVLDHAGAFRHELVLDSLTGLLPGQRALNLTDGPVLEVRPGGDCRQASISGVAAHLNIRYEDLIEVWWSDDRGVTWRPRWAGYADTVPSTRDPDAQPYTLLGLRQRLDRVEARVPIPQGYPNHQWTRLINDCIDSGQLGAALKRAPDAGQGIGAVRAEILPRYESVMMIADKWLTADLEDATAGIGDYGVNARREPIWGKPGGLHILDEADGVIMEGKAGSSARLRTHIRATWIKPGPGPYLVFGKSLLKEQEGAQTSLLVQVADPNLYGHSTRRELLQRLPKFFTRAPCISAEASWEPGGGLGVGRNGGGVIVVGNITGSATITGDVNALNDQDAATFMTVAAAPVKGTDGKFAPPLGGTFAVTVTYPPGPVPWGVAAHVLGGIITGFVFDGVLDVQCPPGQDGLLLFPDEVREWIAEHWNPNDTSRITVRIARTGNGEVQLTTLGALFMDEAEVKRAVQRLAHLPTIDPETIRVPGWNIEPHAFVTCIYRNPDGTEAGRTEGRRVDLYRYVVDADGQQWTEINVGQADEADELAAAALMERRAVTAAQQAAMSR